MITNKTVIDQSLQSGQGSWPQLELQCSWQVAGGMCRPAHCGCPRMGWGRFREVTSKLRPQKEIEVGQKTRKGHNEPGSGMSTRKGPVVMKNWAVRKTESWMRLVGGRGMERWGWELEVVRQQSQTPQGHVDPDGGLEFRGSGPGEVLRLCVF